MSIHGTTWAVHSAQPWEPALPQPWEPQAVTPYEPQPRFYDEFEVAPWQYDMPLPPGHAPWDPGMGGDAPPAGWDAPPPAAVPLPGEPGWQGLDRGLDETGSGAAPRTPDMISTSDHIGHGARSMVVPGLLGGMVGGAFAAGAAQQFKGATFAAHAAKGVIGGVATGAAMGLLVAASSPGVGDDLGARYAVAGGAIGVTAGLMFNRGGGAGVNTAITAGTNALLGWFIGNRLEQQG